MPSVASEANALTHPHPKASRNPSAANSRNPDSAFASLLDTDVEKPAARARKSQDPAPKPPARKPRAASDSRPAASLKQARKPAPEKTPDKDDATKPAETKDETGQTEDIAADPAETLAAEEPAKEIDVSVEEFPALEAEASVAQSVIPAQPSAAALPVAADIIVTAPESEVDLLAQASAQPVVPDNPQETPAIEKPRAQTAPLQAADAEGGENTKKTADTTAKPLAASTSDNADAEAVEAQPQNQSHQGEDEQLHSADAKDAKDAKPDAKPRTHTDIKPEPAQQAQDTAPTAKTAADATQPLTLTPAQIHASATGQAHSASATPDAQAVPVSGLAVEIAAQARAGKNRFEIRLDPPELGRIDVRLDVDREGNVTSRLVIERADTYDLLRRDASTLERALQNAGLKTSDNALEFSLRDQGFARRDEQTDAQRNAAKVIVPGGDEFAGDAVNPHARLLGLGTGVDIRV